MNTKREVLRVKTPEKAYLAPRFIAVALLSMVAAVAGFFITNPSAANTPTPISVAALGDAGGEKIELIADGKVLDTFTLTQALASYTSTAPTRPSNIRVKFINDGATNGTDRNVVVKSITVDAVEHPSTGPSVLSTGSYTAGEGCARSTGRSERLHCNGYFEFRIDDAPDITPPPGTTRVEIRAAGSTGEEVVELRLGGKVLESFTLTKSLTSYTHDINKSVAGRSLIVRFVNDAKGDSGDRNARIDFIAVNGEKIEAEDPNVYSQGSYSRDSGCAGGKKRSEYLHCNGYMEFQVADDVPVAPTTTTTTTTVSTDTTAAPVTTTTTAVASSTTSTTTSTTTTTQPPKEAKAIDVSIFAQGNTGEERIELRIDSRTVARFDVRKGLHEYTWQSEASIGSRSLAVHFVNDSRAGGDRNVALDRIVVAGKQFQTEASDVEILGSWTNGTCKKTGYHRAETLTCNGYAKYDIGKAGQLQDGHDDADVATPTPFEPFPKAGHNGQVGCVGSCKTVGFQDLDGSNGAVLENVIISNSGGPCLSIRDAKNVTIRNVTLQNCATKDRSNRKSIVDITNSSNVMITGSKFVDNASTSVTNYDLIHIENSKNVTIKNNEIRNLKSNTSGGRADIGNRAIRVTGDQVRDLTIEHNSFFDPGRNALQITRAKNISGVKFKNNRIEGRARWDSEFEDMINFYSASGTSSSPILVKGNYLRNGGPSSSGTAIILGDGGSGAASGYITVEKNVIVDPGHVGINVAGGHNFVVKDNIIYGGSNVDHWTSTGFTINHYRYTPECRDHVISGNRVYFKNQHKQHDGTNHIWNPRTCKDNVKMYDNTFGDSSLSYAVWDLK